jgi:uncharacterized membrane protein
MPILHPRIAHETPLVQVQAQGPAGGGVTEPRPLPPGTERAEGAFGVFGMMITGLIIIFAVVILVMRSRRRS